MTVTPPWLTTDWVLGQFSAGRARARERLHEFVLAGIAVPAELPIRGDLYLGSDESVFMTGQTVINDGGVSL